jgi:hypothetical protein
LSSPEQRGVASLDVSGTNGIYDRKQAGKVIGLRLLPRLIDISDWCAGFFGALAVELERERSRQLHMREDDFRH